MENIELIKSEIKNNISVLIEKGNLDAAKDLIIEYENIAPNDIDVYSTKSVIAMIERNFEEAEKILKKGLMMDNRNFDILYNLGYLYQTLQNYSEAFRCYKMALKNTVEEEMKKELNNILDNIKNNYKNYLDVYQYTDRKKVLIIAHIFPPVGGSGVQRTLKFVKYLRDFGWEPIVVTVGETRYPLKDESLINEIPKGIKIIRIDENWNIDNEFISKLIGLYSGVVEDKNLMNQYINELNKKGEEQFGKLILLPDPYIIWTKEVLDKIDYMVDFNEIDLIYSTSGPYSDHIIGYYLKKKYNKPWVVDFRDEWTNNPYARYDKKSIRYRMEFTMENKIVHSADRIITISSISVENYKKIFSLPGNKIKEITNGYDEADFYEINVASQRNDKFTIIHNGLFYGIRTPVTFLKALNNLIKKKLINKKELKILFRKTEEYSNWMELARKLDVDDCIEFIDYSNHIESLVQASKADLLLLIVGPGVENKSVYTGKVFEYLRLSKPILSLAPKGGVVDKLINQTKRGFNVDFENVKEIERQFLKIYKLWANGSQYNFIVDDKIKKYERRELTKLLANVFEEVQDKIQLNQVDKDVEWQVRNMIKQRDLKRAKDLLDQYITHECKNVTFYSLRAIIAMIENDFHKAEKIIKRGLEIDSKNIDLNYNMAYLYELKGQYLKALEYYEKSVFNMGNSEERQKIIQHIKKLEETYKDIIKKQLEENMKNEKNIITSKYNDDFNLHLMYDSNYSKKFIEFINKHFQKHNHLFIIISSEKQNLKFINTNDMENVKVLDLKSDLQELLAYFNRCSKIFIHYLSDLFCMLICKFNVNKKLYWVLWGSDFYNYIDIELYDSITKDLLKKLGLNVENKMTNTIEYIYRRSAIRKINYILTWNKGDYELIKNSFITNAKMLYFYYPNPVDYYLLSKTVQRQEKQRNYNFKKRYKYVVLVGNSADPTNNHLEILYKLKSFKTNEFCIVCPLSYGLYDLYTQTIINEGKKIFGDRFIPLLDFLPSEEYYQILEQVDIAIFNHNRQQAVGNITALIYLGKKIYLKSNVTTFKWAKDLGIKLEDIYELNGNFQEFIEFNTTIKKSNRDIIKRIFNDTNNMKNLMRIFET